MPGNLPLSLIILNTSSRERVNFAQHPCGFDVHNALERGRTFWMSCPTRVCRSEDKPLHRSLHRTDCPFCDNAVVAARRRRHPHREPDRVYCASVSPSDQSQALCPPLRAPLPAAISRRWHCRISASMHSCIQPGSCRSGCTPL